VLRPAAADAPGFEIVRTGDNSFLVRGERPRRWVLQTDFGNDEAVGYLADRLARLGVEESLAELGAQPGAEVLIGDYDDAVVFDWDPELPAGSIAHGDDQGRGGQGGSPGHPAAPDALATGPEPLSAPRAQPQRRGGGGDLVGGLAERGAERVLERSHDRFSRDWPSVLSARCVADRTELGRRPMMRAISASGRSR